MKTATIIQWITYTRNQQYNTTHTRPIQYTQYCSSIIQCTIVHTYVHVQWNLYYPPGKDTRKIHVRCVKYEGTTYMYMYAQFMYMYSVCVYFYEG